MFPVLVLAILIPLADLVLLMMIAKATSVWITVGLIAVSGLVGIWLARYKWAEAARKAQGRIARNELPAELVTELFVGFFVGGLLLMPGLLTDLLGLSVLIPACRRWYQRRFWEWFKNRIRVTMPETELNRPPSAGANGEFELEPDSAHGAVSDSIIETTYRTKSTTGN